MWVIASSEHLHATTFTARYTPHHVTAMNHLRVPESSIALSLLLLALDPSPPKTMAEAMLFSGPLEPTRSTFQLLAGCDLKTETFDSFPADAIINLMPGVDAVMTDEDQNGEIIGFPVLAQNT